MNNYPIIYEKDTDGYVIASCPLFKGCRSYGETKEEALENIKEAILLCIESDELPSEYIGFNELEIA